jgi:hypothetical protein
MEAAVDANTLLYLYGLVAPSSGASVSGLGPDVFVLNVGDVACAAAIVDADEFRQAGEQTTADAQLEWFTPRACRHHDVVGRLHAAGTIIPFKFGTLCRSVEDLGAALSTRRDAIDALFDKLRGKDEWALKMSVNTVAWGNALQASDPELAALAAEAVEASPGRAYFLRKRLQMIVTECVGELVDSLQRLVVKRLDALGVERADGASPAPAGGSSTGGAQFALLVERTRFTEVEAALAALEAEYARQQLAFELVGPWPPYSFATVSV